MVHCSVPFCTSDSLKTPELSFHEFPVDEPRRHQWISNVSRQIDKQQNSQIWLPGEGARVCSLHFLSTDFKTGIKTRRLVSNAVPSVFPHYSSYMQPKENRRRRRRRRLMRQEPASYDLKIMSVITTLPLVETSTEIAQQNVNESKPDTNVIVQRRVGYPTGGRRRLSAYRHSHQDLERNRHSHDLQKSRLVRKLAGSCSVYNCNNHRETCPGKTFFRYPKNKHRCTLWLKNCKRKDLLKVRKKYFYNVYRVCEDHFEDRYFLSYLRNRLHDNAIPTIFEEDTVKKEIEINNKIYEIDSELKSFQNENLISNDDDDDDDDKTKSFIDSEETKDMLNINNIIVKEENFTMFHDDDDDDDKQEGKERKWCAAVSCGHEVTSQSEGLQFFKFPEDYEIKLGGKIQCPSPLKKSTKGAENDDDDDDMQEMGNALSSDRFNKHKF